MYLDFLRNKSSGSYQLLVLKFIFSKQHLYDLQNRYKFSDASSILKKTILKILNQVKPLNAFGYSIIRFQRSITIFVHKARASNIGIRHIMLIKFEQNKYVY